MDDAHTIDPQTVIEAFGSANLGYAVTDRHGVLRHCSEEFCRQTGLQCKDNHDETIWFEFDPAPAEVHAERRELWHAFISKHERWQGVVRWYLDDGSVRFFEGTAIPRKDGSVILITMIEPIGSTPPKSLRKQRRSSAT